MIQIGIAVSDCTYGYHELGSLELPEGDINGNAALTLGL